MFGHFHDFSSFSRISVQKGMNLCLDILAILTNLKPISSELIARFLAIFGNLRAKKYELFARSLASLSNLRTINY